MMSTKTKKLKKEIQKLNEELKRSKPKQLRYRQITDTTDDNAENRIRDAVLNHTEDRGIVASFSLSAAYNSITIGTKVNESATNSQRPKNSVVAVNYAPPDREGGTVNNARNGFFCAELKNGMHVCGTSNGFEFSYVKPLITEFYELTNTNHKGSQFRSLEILPEYAIRFTEKKERKNLIKQGILKPVKVNDIVPDVPDTTHVLEVDNFGNVKLYLSKADRSMLEQAVVKGMTTGKKPKVWLQFGKAALEVGVDHRNGAFGGYYEAAASETLFAAPLNTNVIGRRSSSTLLDKDLNILNVPVIATIRLKPGETRPVFDGELPAIGARVRLRFTKPPARDMARLSVG